MPHFTEFTNLVPDWSMVMTADHAEKDLKDFKFKGVGLYSTPTDDLLVFDVPNLLSNEKHYMFYCYNDRRVHDALMSCLEHFIFIPKFSTSANDIV